MKGGSHMRLASTLVLLATLCAGSVARAEADPQAKAKAEALFSEAMKLSSRGEHEKACESLDEAVRLTEREAIGGILELARCKEKLGKTASAWALYREVMAKAARTGQTERERDATRAANELEPRLHTLKLSLAPELARTAGLVIREGSIELGRAAWTLPTPVDPGEIEVEVSAPGKKSFSRKVQIPAEPGTTRLALPALEDEAGSPDARTREPAASRPSRAEGGSGGTRVAGAVVAGAGVAAMAASGVLILIAKSEWDDAHSSECDGDVCSRDGKDRIDAARDKGTIATVVFGAGAALTITGTVLFLASPSSVAESARRPALGVGAAAWSRGGAVTLGGRF